MIIRKMLKSILKWDARKHEMAVTDMYKVEMYYRAGKYKGSFLWY